MNQENPQSHQNETVPAGMLPDWTVGDLPKPPRLGWKSWAALLGPGVLMAGASIGSGEWLAGPGVTAQYGGTLLWVATLSIVAQVFCNLEFMRYALYCGEPILVGAFRTKPGPKFWTVFYALLEFGHIWPYNVAGASVAVAAIWLGSLPGQGDDGLVHGLSCVLFLLAFLPLIFGGTVYKMLERIMTVKLVVVLIFLVLVSTCLISSRSMSEVLSGFLRFGQIPLRANTIIDGRHFTLTEQHDDILYRIRGTVEETETVVTEFTAGNQIFRMDQEIPAEFDTRYQELKTRAEKLALADRFYMEQIDGPISLTAEGTIDPQDKSWQFEQVTVRSEDGSNTYRQLADIPNQALQKELQERIENQGLRRVQLIGYIQEHGKLPDLDWALIATFASIAGAGGLTNALLSNYARDKGWGMGR
ncbi:MAG: hypothetical protein CMJ62_09335, partial [Planctomycetaceae bacterium]|nr:hypothetical protein [Planctomycetaceae bacterium]